MSEHDGEKKPLKYRLGFLSGKFVRIAVIGGAVALIAQSIREKMMKKDTA